MPAAKKPTRKVAPKKVATKKTPRAKNIRFDSVADLRGYIQQEVEKESHRMVPKVVTPVEVIEEEPTAPDADLATWGPKPSVADQLAKHPTSIRYKPPVTAQFVLSDAKSLEAWNALQVRAHPPEAPQIQLSGETTFAPAISSYVILASYSEIEYQQI